MNRKLAAQIIKSQEEERERIARDLHDQLGGTLAAVKMHIEANSGNDDWTVQTINLLNKASEDVRNIAHNLMPKDFERTNLETILQSFFYRLNIPGTMKFKFYSNPSPAQLPKQFQLILFRIILELVTNINKHSGATEASVQLIYHDAGLDLIVEDNGKGIQANTREGLGLKNIRSRVAFLQGKMVIDSTVAGTTTIINIPYK